MKLLVLNYEYPPLGGGAGVISQYISEGLAAIGYKVTVVTTGTDNLPDDTQTGLLRIIRLPARRKFSYRSNPLEMWSWMRLANRFLNLHLKTEKYDLCFANFSIPGGLVALNMFRRKGLPYTLISHGHDIPWFFPRQMFWYHLMLYHTIRHVVLNSRLNFVQSDEMKRNIDAFTGSVFSSKNVIVPNGWNGSVFAPDYSKRSSEFVVLFTGRLVRQKDPFTLLKAIRMLNGKIPVRLHIMGDGPLRKKMEAFVEKHRLTEVCQFYGWVGKDEMLVQYQSAALTVLPSLSEGMSIATLEALACGQYVIATKVSNNEALISEGKNGNLIEIGNHTQLAELIQGFYHTKFMKGFRIDEHELHRYRTQYNWSDIVKQYDRYFVSLP